MPQQHNAMAAHEEGRIILALQAYHSGQFKNIHRAADAYNVSASKLYRRRAGIPSRRDIPPNKQKLTPTEETTIVRYILDLDARGFSPRICEVEDMANKLLEVRGQGKVGKCWASRFIKRSDELKMSFNRAKDRQRAKQEDPVVISDWFQRVANTKAKYGIPEEDTYNFDETGFQMGVIGSMKVVTGSERRSRPDLVQPGDREWVTVIQGIGAGDGFVIPPFIIYKGRVHLSGWYEEKDIPGDWVLAVSENGWTTNELGYAWLKHFDACTRTRQVGLYRLLVLDGHESHLSQDFKDYCEENKIVTLCMPAHSSHILQPLDVGCFAPLKVRYSQRVRALASRRVFHIDKMGFLPAFRDAFFETFTKENILGGFRGAGLVPLDAQRVLDKLDIRPQTPPGPPPDATPWQTATPSNTQEFALQSNLVSNKLGSSPSSAKNGFQQLVKGAELMLHQNALMAARIKELEELNEELTRRKSRKRKRIQTGGVLEFGEASNSVAAGSPSVRGNENRAGGGEGSGTAQRTQRSCGRCGGTGHNVRTCSFVEEEGPELEPSNVDNYSHSGGEEINNSYG